MAARQIPLPFARFEKLDFALYLPGRNREAVVQLQNIGADSAPGNLYLWGNPGTGKSHLLQALCTRAADSRGTTAYIPLSQLDELSTEMLEGLEQLDLVCIDDLQRVAGITHWEQALFHLFNRLRDNARSLVIAATSSPGGIGIELPDLKSRLSWGLTYHLQPLREAECLTALQQRARARGFTLPDEVAAYLVKRIPRDTHTMFQLLDRLDQASLAEKKRLTVPFVRRLLDSD